LSSDSYGVRSFSPPVAAYTGTWVFPRSTTSGASDWASAVVSFVVMPSHCWVCSFTFAPVALVNCVSAASSTFSLRSPFIIQTVMVLPFPSGVPMDFVPLSEAPLLPAEHPVRASAAARPSTPSAVNRVRVTLTPLVRPL
jgi:hypothetical protein